MVAWFLSSCERCMLGMMKDYVVISVEVLLTVQLLLSFVADYDSRSCRRTFESRHSPGFTAFCDSVQRWYIEAKVQVAGCTPHSLDCAGLSLQNFKEFVADLPVNFWGYLQILAKATCFGWKIWRPRVVLVNVQASRLGCGTQQQALAPI